MFYFILSFPFIVLLKNQDKQHQQQGPELPISGEKGEGPVGGREEGDEKADREDSFNSLIR